MSLDIGLGRSFNFVHLLNFSFIDYCFSERWMAPSIFSASFSFCFVITDCLRREKPINEDSLFSWNCKKINHFLSCSACVCVCVCVSLSSNRHLPPNNTHKGVSSTLGPFHLVDLLETHCYPFYELSSSFLPHLEWCIGFDPIMWWKHIIVILLNNQIFSLFLYNMTKLQMTGNDAQ